MVSEPITFMFQLKHYYEAANTEHTEATEADHGAGAQYYEEITIRAG